MMLTEMLLMGVALSMDAVAVSLSCGMTAKSMKPLQGIRIAFFFGVFQAVMPAIGYLAGSGVHGYIAAVDHWIAFALLMVIGLNMAYQQWKSIHEEECEIKDISKISNLLVMSLATSVDALAVGIGLALTSVNIAVAAPVIGMVTFILSLMAVFVGRRCTGLLSKYAGYVGGIILIFIGARILAEHLAGAA